MDYIYIYNQQYYQYFLSNHLKNYITKYVQKSNILKRKKRKMCYSSMFEINDFDEILLNYIT